MLPGMTDTAENGSGENGWTAEESALLSRYVTNLSRPVFALRNLPEVVKGALFARYSRSHKDLRRLLVDEFADDLADSDTDGRSTHVDASGVDADSRASRLYRRVLDGFGDDSVADLGSAHLACEEVSNVLTKILERGRLMSYLEQSTRYIAYDTPLRGRWRYRQLQDHTDPDAPPVPDHAVEAYTSALDTMFDSYSDATRRVTEWLHNSREQPADVTEPAWQATVRAKALDATRGMLPAATLSNVGIHGSARAFEALILRMLAHPLPEARCYAQMMVTELRRVIPEFLHRVDDPRYGGAAVEYRQMRLEALADSAAVLNVGLDPVPDPGSDWRNVTVDGATVMLLDWTEHAEQRIAAASLWPHLDCSEATVRDAVARLDSCELDRVFDTLRGERLNRRHRPGRELETVDYRFEVVSDYGAYRDLQRHRMLTIEAQPLTTSLGSSTPSLIVDADATPLWQRAMEASHDAHRLLTDEAPHVAAYPVAMAYRLRYVMQFNVREALHMIELRSQPQGHPVYRRVVQAMLHEIAHTAGHRRIAGLFTHADLTDGDRGRLDAEQRTAERQSAK